MSSKRFLPMFVCGTVVKGFGRGSKDLGIPTANLSESVVEKLPSGMDTGIYYGLASVDRGPVYKMVMSVGWNPFYKNEKKSMEAHLIHKFENDFYGSQLRLIVIDYIRPEKSFKGLDDLISAIQEDIRYADEKLMKSNVKNGHHSFWDHPRLVGNDSSVSEGVFILNQDKETKFSKLRELEMNGDSDIEKKS